MSAVFEALIARPPACVRDLSTVLDVPLEAFLREGSVFGVAIASCPESCASKLAMVRISLHGDIYRPTVSEVALGEQRIRHYVADFREGRAACEAVLVASFGPPSRRQRGAAEPRRPGDVPRSTPARARSYEQYGPFFVEDAPDRTDDALSLEWFETQPDWAMPEVDPEKRRRALREIARRIAHASTSEHVREAIHERPEGVGIRLTESHGRYGFRLEPPVPALVLAEVLGVRKPEKEARGSHQSNWQLLDRRWRLVRRGWRCTFRSLLAPSRLGAWRVEATLDDVLAGREQSVSEDGVIREVVFSPLELP